MEQHAGRSIPDVLTLHSSPEPLEPDWLPPDQTVEQTLLARRRTLAIRHVSGHRLIALIEIISPGNKDRARHVDELVNKAAAAVEHGVHVLLLDLFPPGPHDPSGIHGSLLQALQPSPEPYVLPANAPLTLASYVAGPQVDIYIEHLAVGSPLPEMPLFLRPDRYVNVPLEPTYQAAYRGTPAVWREVLESGGPQFPPAGGLPPHHASS